METPEWLTLGGWIATFILGILSSVLMQKLVADKKIIGWSVLSENEVFSEKISENFSLPVKIIVNNSESNSLSSLQLRVGNVGNVTIDKLKIIIKFNKGCNILYKRFINDLGAYHEHIASTMTENIFILNLEFINRAQVIDLDFLLGNYEMGSVFLDFSAPGVEKRKKESTRWDLPEGILRGFALGLLGIRYDPSVIPLTEIATELKSINNKLKRNKG